MKHQGITANSLPQTSTGPFFFLSLSRIEMNLNHNNIHYNSSPYHMCMTVRLD